MTYQSWGRYPKVQQTALGAEWIHEPLPQTSGPLLPYGMGRSYGDSCLNDDHHVLLTRHLDRFISFDPQSGRLICESGVTFAEIIDLVVNQGWFLPVTPGTKFVTVGGALANDVHGKNHHRAGSFGNHVLRFELLRSDGSRRVCLPEDEWFKATVGGLGLTGLITWAEIQLKPIRNSYIAQDAIPFANLQDFFELSAQSEKQFEYTVAWIDCLAKGKSLGRGIFYRGNSAGDEAPRGERRKSRLSVPFEFPNWVLNGLTMSAFNHLYYAKGRMVRGSGFIHYDPFFYPLDGIHSWNRIYGRRGFLQYQFVVPSNSEGRKVVREILESTSNGRMGTFLAVLKVFGDVPSRGLLSFPRPGITLCLDFPYTGDDLLKAMSIWDRKVIECGGAVYPAKDARMSREMFEFSFPQLQVFKNFVDPQFSSSFWRRVNGKGL